MENLMINDIQFMSVDELTDDVKFIFQYNGELGNSRSVTLKELKIYLGLIK